MKEKPTKQWLLDQNPCRDGLAFAESCGFDFAKIYKTCEHGDWLIWLLRKSEAIDKKQAVLLACECAEHVLAIYEKKYPQDLRPRKAIEAALAWAANPNKENKKAASAAAAASSAYAASAYASSAASAYAAYAASAASAASDAAYASDAADAAYASDAAASSAAAAAAAVCLTERKWQANKIRSIIPNPYK